MKIATITYSWAQNWGAVLQAHALVEYLNALGHDARLINYRQFDNKLISTIKSISDGIVDILTMPANKRRITRYNEFRNNALQLTKLCCTTEELTELNNEFDAFITGSDQVWNAGKGVCKAFYLDFVFKHKKKISYAASFGSSSIPVEYQQDSIDGINSIGCLSVREKSGADIVKELTGREATVVLDPVFLLEKEHWMKISNQELKFKKPYIFVYPTQITKTLTEIIRELRRNYDYEVITPFYIPGCQTIKDIGPREFIGYIANAEYIVTSSYHAAVFSILFKKKFFAVAHSATGSRMTDLLKLLKLDSCCINESSNIFDICWNYDEVEPELGRMVMVSKAFLQESLSTEELADGRTVISPKT